MGPVVPGGPVYTVALAGVALGGDCGTGAAGSSRACALNAPNCGCQQSTLQIKISATAGQGSEAFAITAVRMYDQGGHLVDQLTPRDPQRWSGNVYTAWDQVIAPSDDFNATYNLSAPNWAAIDPSGPYDSTASYRVEVDVAIGGQARTVGLDGVTREAPIST
jgi:hypothetical protein